MGHGSSAVSASQLQEEHNVDRTSYQKKRNSVSMKWRVLPSMNQAKEMYGIDDPVKVELRALLEEPIGK
jgi:hypothetical protein